MSIEAEASRIMMEQTEWLEDIAAGLLSNGVTPGEVEVQYHPDLRIVVVVRGAPLYEWRPGRATES